MKNYDKNRAAYLLSDEIYGSFRGVSIARRLLSNMYEFYVDEEDLAKLEGYEAILRLSELSWRMELLVTQLCGVAETLGKLDTAAKEYSLEPDPYRTSGTDQGAYRRA